MVQTTKILTKRYSLDQSWTLAVAESAGAYQNSKKVIQQMSPDAVKEEVKAANIRGRGGAGFPAGVKWGFMSPKPGQKVYLTVNADEGEPGTFKDRTIMERDPHRLIEGCVITCFAVGAEVAYIYVRHELQLAIRRLEQAVSEAKAKGYLGPNALGNGKPLQVHVHTGAGAYICGEETSMLNSLEGRRGEPRLKPPFPAQVGAFGQPTLVNNVETIAAIPDIIEMGGKQWSQLGLLPNDGGVRLYGVSGHVKRPGIYEAPVGISLRDLIFDLGGGMLDESRPLKAVVPGGSSTPVLRPDKLVHAPDEKHPLHAWHGQSEIDVPMGVDTFRALGTMLGTCGAIVMDSSVNMVEACRNLMKFYKHESCGQCTPCREGSGWLVDILDGLVEGRGKDEDVDLLVNVANNMMGNTICAFADGTAMPMLGFIRQFKEEFVAAAAKGVAGPTIGRAAEKLVEGRAA